MVGERGEMEAWVYFFLDAVKVQSSDAVRRAELLIDLRERYRHAVLSHTRSSALVVDLAFERPILSAPLVEHKLDYLAPAHARCNNDKRAALAGLEHLARWSQRFDDTGRVSRNLDAAAADSDWPRRPDATLASARALYCTSRRDTAVARAARSGREIGSRLLFLEHGGVLEEGDPRQMFADLQHPRTQEFFSQIL